MKSLMLTLGLILTAGIAHGTTTAMTQIKIDKKTPTVTPAEQIYQFAAIDWDKIEIRQEAGIRNDDSIVMMCDDSYYQLVELKLPEGLETEVTIDSDCALHGASHDGEYSPAFLQFNGPDGSSSCTIKVQKTRAGGKKPLVINYEIHDAC